MLRQPSTTAALALLTLLVTSGAPAALAQQATPADTVQAFNAAISGRDLNKATTYFADGAVQFTLRPAHAGMAASAPQGLSMDLKGHWTQVGTLLFSVTSRYTRTPTILDTRVEGDLATLWAQIDTETLERNAREPRLERFAEVYLLVRKDGAWRIAGIADNRGATRAGSPPPAR
jgi:ketosteroid isomerase-like protein